MKGDIRGSRLLCGRFREILDGVAAGIMRWAQRDGVVDGASMCHKERVCIVKARKRNISKVFQGTVIASLQKSGEP